MDRAGNPAKRLSLEECEIAFKAVVSGRSIGSVQNELGRTRKTIGRVVNVVKQFETRQLESINRDIALEIVDMAGNGATTSYIESMFIVWRRWKDETETDISEDKKSPARNDEADDEGQLLQERHVSALIDLAAELRRQLTIPLPYSRVRESARSRAQHLARSGHGQGAEWYWGWETVKPVLSVELRPDFPLLKEHLVSSRIPASLDALRHDLHDYIDAREELLSLIEKASIDATGLGVWNRGNLDGGSITGGFSLSLFNEASLLAATGEEPAVSNRYAVDADRTVEVPPRMPSSPASENVALTFDGTVIAWLPPGQAFRLSDYERHREATEAHSKLVWDWSSAESMRAIVVTYHDLRTRVDSLRVALAAPAVASATSKSTCSACV